MSHNQSRGEPQARRPSRSGAAGQSRTYSAVGGGGRGGGGVGGYAPPVPPSNVASAGQLPANRSFKRVGNVQGGQPVGQPVAGPQAGVTVPAPAARVVGNGPQSQTPSQASGAQDASLPNAPKTVDVSAPKPTRVVPRPPSSQSSSGTLDTNTKGGASNSFTLQFGSIAPGFVNGMPVNIPARTSSAPPNLDEQKKDQASRGIFGASAPTVPPASIPKQQTQMPTQNDATGSTQANSGSSHPLPELKKDNVVKLSTPHTMIPQKSSGLSVPGMSGPIFPQQAQMPMPFNPNIQVQPQHVPAGSLQMPIAQMPIGNPSQLFGHVQGIQPHVMHTGQGIGFATHMSPHVPPTMGNARMVSAQYPQPQAGQYGGSRKTSVKITDPITHEEVTFNKKPDTHVDPSSQRSHIPSQTQPPAFSAAQMNFFPNTQPPYAANTYYLPLPLGNAQSNVSQTPRFNFPVQSVTPVSFINPSIHTSVTVSKPVSAIHKDSDQAHLGYLQGGNTLPVPASSSVTVTLKPAANLVSDKARSGPVAKDGEPKPAKSVQVSSITNQQKESGGGLQIQNAQSNSSAISIVATPTPTDNEYEEPLHSDSGKDILKNLVHFQQGERVDVLESSSSLSLGSSKLQKETYPCIPSGKHQPESSEYTSLLSKTVETPSSSSSTPPVAEHVDYPEAGVSEKSDKACLTGTPVLCEEKDALKNASNKLDGPNPVTNGVVLRDEPSVENLNALVTDHRGDTLVIEQRQEIANMAEASKLGAYDNSLTDSSQDSRGSLISFAKGACEVDHHVEVAISPGHLNADDNVKNGDGEMKGCGAENNGALEELVTESTSSTDASIASIKISTVQENILPVLGDSTLESGNLTDIDSHRNLPLAIDSESNSSERSQKVEEKAIETGSQPSHSSSSVKEKLSIESQAKTVTGKKKRIKEILLRADAAGTNSDLYMAYKRPEEQQSVAVSSEGIDGSVVNTDKVHAEAMVEDLSRKEDGLNKTDVDDWEDVVEIHSPKLEASEKLGRHPSAKKLGQEFGGSVNSKKKYSRDFLLTFKDQCINLPIGFEIVPDVASLLCSPQVGISHGGNNEMLAGHARNMDRPNPAIRSDRRSGGYLDDDKWGKSTNLSSGREVGHGANTGFRVQGASHGVLKNPRGQGGILPGQLQPLSAQGPPRNNVDADRWLRSSSMHRGLIPSPQTPAMEMHKAERKYVVGKISDEEEAKQRQIKAILNKLTPQNFDRLFQQVKEVNIDNASTLTGVISQIFDKALMEPTFCEMYADFCFHLADELPDFKEDNEKITFKRLLLNKCQEEFERGEIEQAEAEKVEEEGEVKQSEEAKEEKRIRARRRMLGNIRLIGELYKKKMLTERIMHECIRKLLGKNQNPDEEDIESLCKLMSTIGAMIDHFKAKELMDSYFATMKNLSVNTALSSRVRFMLRDAIDLRKNNWLQRRKVEGPKRIEEVHRDAHQERSQAARSGRGSGMGSSTRRGPPTDYGSRGSMPLSSSGSHQTGNLRIPVQARGYGSQDVRTEEKHLYESRSLSLPLSKPLGDDSITLGPQGGLAKGMSSRGQPLMANPPLSDVSGFSGEAQRLIGPNGHSFPSDRAYRSTKDLGRPDKSSDGMSSKVSTDEFLASSTGNSGASSPSVSLEELRDKSISAIREYYSAKDEKEVSLCVRELNSPSFYPTMISLWVTDSFERKDIDRELLSKLLVNLCKSGDHLVSQAQLREGFELVLATLEDAVSDAPRAAEFLGRIFVRTILEEVISFKDIGRLISKGGEDPGRLLEIGLAAEVLGNMLDIIRTEKGDATIKELLRSSSMDLESFRPPLPLKSRKLEQFL